MEAIIKTVAVKKCIAQKLEKRLRFPSMITPVKFNDILFVTYYVIN